MWNLIIGLCFGIVSAVALVVMWRLAERLRKEVQSREAKAAEGDGVRTDIPDDHSGGQASGRPAA
jgi:flagellar biosynthesis/type III secretory pathway M-ring protein FliF/YscJ